MKLTLNDNKLQMTSLAGLMIFTAVVLKNGGEQMGMKQHFLSAVVGKILFVAGWAYMAYAISGMPSLNMSNKAMMSYLGALLVVMAVMMMKLDDIPKLLKKMMPGMFIVGWILTALSVGMNKSAQSQMLSVLALMSIFGSMLVILPKQRKLNVIDGPGMALFAATFVLLAVANSM
jgi:hypothetical protein